VDRSLCVRVTGPLAAYAAGFRVELVACGYAPLSTARHLLVMARMSGWLEARGLDAGVLTSQQVGQFLRADREQGHGFPQSSPGLVPLLTHLRGVGAVPPEQAAVLSEAEQLLARFGTYLASERGLRAATIVGYVHAARLFLDALGHGHNLEHLTPVDVRQFLLAECERCSVGSAKRVVSGLRAWLRFLHVEGVTSRSLSGSVPAVAGWGDSGMPRAIDTASVVGAHVIRFWHRFRDPVTRRVHYVGARMRRRSRSNFARPNIWRLIILMRLTCLPRLRSSRAG
jgi:integrase/recombinase XerD